MIPRLQISYALERLFQGKALIIYGARQVGKTTFCEQLLEHVSGKVLRLNGDDTETRDLLQNPGAAMLRTIIGDHEVVLIDEAQRISEAGLLIKIIVDQLKTVQVIATGSSAFELAGSINEPLTGRKYEINLSPLSYLELLQHTDYVTEHAQLPHRLVYGSYPEVVNNPSRAEEHLGILADSYLYKDLFALEQIKRPALFEKIVKALALQVGSEVSLPEISGLVGADSKTVEKYITLLEQAFVVFTLPAFSRNVRNEIRKGRKIYFHDNGILNAVTGNFKPITARSDVGALWENYLVSERRKFLAQHGIKASSWFWRTTQQQEVDYLETQGNRMLAAEFKWNPTAAERTRIPLTFRNAYPEAETIVVSPENRHEWLGGA
jgi:uncharacterized protein